MNWDEFADWSRQIADWGAAYHKSLRDRPVRAQTVYGEIAAQLQDAPPETGEDMSVILEDFEQIVMPGMTHWQHPRFFAYFSANAAPPSILAEQLVNTVAAQCMLWQTSPAATEVEGVMVDWLRQALGLAEGYTGVIQDSASSATLSAVLTMRERATGFTGNREGLSTKGQLRLYCSEGVHSSIDRACWVAGIGQDNLVKLPTSGPRHAMDTAALEAAIEADLAAGHVVEQLVVARHDGAQVHIARSLRELRAGRVIAEQALAFESLRRWPRREVLHRWRLARRRFNQAALLAQVLARDAGVAVRLGALRRVRQTASQGGLNRQARRRNVRGAFRLNAGEAAQLLGRTVLLVDDVYTTGATVAECSRVLRRAGAKAVDVLTLARVLRDSETGQG